MIIRAYIHAHIGDRKGFTLLLMIVLLAAFLSFAMGIFNILLGQIIVVGQAGESFGALYAADTGIERTLYRDRVQNICGTTDCGSGGAFTNLPNGACYRVDMNPPDLSIACLAPDTRCIKVTGQNICGGAQRFVQRKFGISY